MCTYLNRMETRRNARVSDVMQAIETDIYYESDMFCLANFSSLDTEIESEIKHTHTLRTIVLKEFFCNQAHSFKRFNREVTRIESEQKALVFDRQMHAKANSREQQLVYLQAKVKAACKRSEELRFMREKMHEQTAIDEITSIIEFYENLTYKLHYLVI